MMLMPVDWLLINTAREKYPIGGLAEQEAERR
jgi:hypothetical protein